MTWCVARKCFQSLLNKVGKDHPLCLRQEMLSLALSAGSLGINEGATVQGIGSSELRATFHNETSGNDSTQLRRLSGSGKPTTHSGHSTDPGRLYHGVGSQTPLEVPHEHDQECEDAQQGHTEP